MLQAEVAEGFDSPGGFDRLQDCQIPPPKDGGSFASVYEDQGVIESFNENEPKLTQVPNGIPLSQDTLNFLVLKDAFNGKRGPDQERIAKEGIAWVSMLIRKNADYGSSAWKRPLLAPECGVDTAMRVRMSDKIERIMSLLQKDGPEIAEESIRDTMQDLGAYCLLWLACPDCRKDLNCDGQ